jgi:ATP-dependent protease HslVU (ClpYQ) peptidase subunit
VTCVVALVDRGKIYMGADSAGSTASGHIRTRIDKKVFMVGDLMFGICGSFRLRDILQYHTAFAKYNAKLYTPLEYVNHEIVSKVRDTFKSNGFTRIENNEEEFDGSFIVGFKKKIFEVECDFQAAEVAEPYLAIGSGGDRAHASFSTTSHIKGITPIERVQLALQVAADGNAFVRPPFYISTLDAAPKKKK